MKNFFGFFLKKIFLKTYFLAFYKKIRHLFSKGKRQFYKNFISAQKVNGFHLLPFTFIYFHLLSTKKKILKHFFAILDENKTFIFKGKNFILFWIYSQKKKNLKTYFLAILEENKAFIF